MKLDKIKGMVLCFFGKHKAQLRWLEKDRTKTGLYDLVLVSRKAKINCMYCGIKMKKIHYSEIMQ